MELNLGSKAKGASSNSFSFFFASSAASHEVQTPAEA